MVSALIKEHQIDLVVIGTHGRKGLEKLVIGSVAEKILRRSPVPVLTVGPHVHMAPEQTTQTKQILFATDFGPASREAAPYAISLAQESQAHLDLLHVVEPQKAGELVHPRELMNAAARQLRKFVPEDAELWCEPEYLVEQGDAAERIRDVAKRRGADMIVMGVKRAEGDLGASAHFPWAIAHKVIAGTGCPVLTVRG